MRPLAFRRRGREAENTVRISVSVKVSTREMETHFRPRSAAGGTPMLEAGLPRSLRVPGRDEPVLSLLFEERFGQRARSQHTEVGSVCGSRRARRLAL